MNTSSAIATIVLRLPNNRAEIVVPIRIVSPPLWERSRRPARTKYSKRQDEQARQARTVECARNEIRVVFEQAWSVVAKIKLRVESHNRPAEDDTRLRLVVRNIARKLEKGRKVDFAEIEVSNLRNKLVYD
jgi:hypothetical protein